jgi:hypothetical protein
MTNFEQLNGNVTLTPRDDFSEFGIRTDNLSFNGLPTKYQTINKNGELVAIMTKVYKVMPNEQVKTEVESLIDRIGAKPFVPAKSKYDWCETDDKGASFNGPLRTQMSLSYLFPEKFDITGEGDHVRTGFNVINSEDGTYGLGISPFVLRNSCDNRMYHLSHENILGERVRGIVNLKNKAEVSANIRTARGELRKLKTSRRHSKNLDLEYIYDVVGNIKQFSTKVIDRYREMYELKVNQVMADKLAKAMPKRVTDGLNWMNINKKSGAVTLKDVGQWDAFNDITESLTYGKAGFAPTLKNYKALDKIMVAVK